MEKITYPVINLKGAKVSDITLDARVFGQPTREDIVHDVVVWQRNKARAGTHSCLRKGAMKGCGRKPWKQKGTGRARVGSADSPLWVGGGVAHGPHPRKYVTRLTKRRRSEGLTSVLSDKLRDGTLVVVDSLTGMSPKTKEVSTLISNLCKGSTSAIVSAVAGSDTIAQATRNVKSVLFLEAGAINAYDLLKKNYLVVSKDAVEALQNKVIGSSACADDTGEEA